MIITIDGPVASGKSSAAKALATELGIYYLYTGLLYRAVAYIMLQRKSDLKRIEAKMLTFVKDICYDYGKENGQARPYVFYEGQEITSHLYDVTLDQAASIVSANKHVRESLLNLQRSIAKKYDIVADGRDCGSVIFPQADYKFYITADIQARAERLMLDPKRGAENTNLQHVITEIEKRDARDKERDVAPLTVPENAIIVDNTSLTQEETVNKLLRFIKK